MFEALTSSWARVYFLSKANLGIAEIFRNCLFRELIYMRFYKLIGEALSFKDCTVLLGLYNKF